MEATTETQQQTSAVDTAAAVTKKFIEKLEGGVIPWHNPWGGSGIPYNPVTKHQYQGLNAMMLGMAGWKDNLFLTFDQVNSLGGKVKRGEKGCMLIRWDKPKPDAGEAGVPVTNGSSQKSTLKHYVVFNVQQCELPDSKLNAEDRPQLLTSPDAIAQGMPKCPKIRHKEQRVFYDLMSDSINMPKLKGLKDSAQYFWMLYRQLVHATGHDSRLARLGTAEMSEVVGSELFSKEDLVGAIGSCVLLSMAGLMPEIKHAPADVAGWLEQLNKDKWLIIRAGGDAQRAVEFILAAEGGQATNQEK